MAIQRRYIINDADVQVYYTFDDADPMLRAEQIVVQVYSTLYNYTVYVQEPGGLALKYEVAAASTLTVAIPAQYRKAAFDTFTWGAYASSRA